MTIRILYLTFNDIPADLQAVAKLRGYLAGRFPQITELHNHLPDNRFNYNYPVVQYRTIDGYAAIMAIRNGIDIVMDLAEELDCVKLGEHIVEINERQISFCEHPTGVDGLNRRYSFKTPWIALSEKNYDLYKDLRKSEKQPFLDHLLRENLKTLAKGCGYTIEDIDKIKVQSDLKQEIITMKNRSMICFTGNFEVNYLIPAYFGLGKRVAGGYGVVCPAE